ncbi:MULTISPECIES: methyl-accepting chemotaxis protein [unclassified Rhizobium]|uniref:methyl-accepting chemotaxis protein n=1 Tax=unclassified Rhizobium TaxID=2613769 RepID=UPI001ADD1941|nr:MULTISPECIES: methyl-accepting chemotaxis protein [unclassified Rhizobium]MBO9098979.1 Cache 3/Cache 2 fusion domain-containing protein [Rhizobium sp. L58/93]MBO9132214.1 Cache 3/Cache 2 fusion domain-containing protein [Rhizobium sp. B209b/85]MBO9169243.1 Cache 3/Cache 2 fusion domain-containing protein [Rhizobium sp. L245/93]MBO9185193.1 Cache 3/Cache 2 fusion domain-containing protein [Rhizobium sp. E27B/91]QXZ85340.1 Cache 3/Cache 2 fusion domain-containing protein [Rhizobium sp. K1/93]
MNRLLPSTIVSQIVFVTIGLIFLGISAVAGATYYQLRERVLTTAADDVRDASRAMAVIYSVKLAGTTVDIRDGELRGIVHDGAQQVSDHDLVDKVATSIGGVATIFQVQDGDYLRISTNVKKENGERAVGTKLAADHPARPMLAAGKPYYGEAVLFGKPYITGYFPIRSTAGATTGVLFTGIPMQVYSDQIDALRTLILIVGAAAMMAIGLLAYVTTGRLIRPLTVLRGSVQAISSGTLDTAIPYLSRRNEFGDIARALEGFRDNARAKQLMEGENARQRASVEEERARNESDKRSLDSQIDFAVEQLAGGLARLAQGDLSHDIDTPFAGRLEQLRIDFNGSLVRLKQTMVQIRENTLSIQGSGSDMRQSALDLAKRTEDQAASLEETAAAVEEITVTVRSSADRARDVQQVVGKTRKTASSSESVVNNAIEAMGRIESGARQIEQIIEVIDSIAFQTNLLALNAGIEAARAGDAGKGFAVVAHEVRELAQRSADAAKQIKGLIDQSTAEVKTGSALVREAGQVLTSISTQIVEISKHIDTIATAAQDQASALQEVNSSVNAMDQMTQKNAAMVADTTAASNELADEADALLTIVQQFRTDDVTQATPRMARAA